MANTILTPTEVTREVIRILHNNMPTAKHANRQYDSRFAKEGGKIGDTLNVRKPAEYTIGTGADITGSINDHVDQSVPIVVADRRHCAVEFSSKELTLDLQDFSERVLKPAVTRLAAEVDMIGCRTVMQNVYNEVGTPGSPPGSSRVFLQAGAVLDNYAAPRDMRRCTVLNPAGNAEAVEGLKGLFNPTSDISKQYKSGLMAPSLGSVFEMSQNVNTLTAGTHDTAYQTNEAGGVSNGDTTIAVDTGTGTINQGEIFTISGIYEVNPETKIRSGRLKQFVCRSNYAGGAGNIQISPTIYVSGARQNVSNSNAGSTWDNLALTFQAPANTTYPVNFQFHKDSLTLVTADLEDVSKMGAWGSRMSEGGISVRVARQWNVMTDMAPTRIDVLFGWAFLRAEHACRIAG